MLYACDQERWGLANWVGRRAMEVEDGGRGRKYERKGLDSARRAGFKENGLSREETVWRLI